MTTVRPAILQDLVADVTMLLGSDHSLCLDGTWRRVQPADLAVLVRTNERGEAVRDSLVAAGVPAVMLGAGSVFTSAMAQEWLTLLAALEQPRQQLARRAALTPFVGWTFAELAEASEPRLTDLAQRVRGWSRVLAGRGVAALLETMTTDTQLPERLLRTVGGERRLTDLRHLAEALHAAMVAGPLGVGALREWLQERMAEARARLVGDGTRRLETDAEAVTVVTVHRSKGLEYPIVYLPEAWDRHVESRDEGRTLLLHEAGEAVLDVGGRSGPGRAERFRTASDEEAGENLRLLYVALTRAQCQVVTWWAPSRNTPCSPLQRYLYRTLTEGAVPAASYPLSGDPFTARPLGAGVSLEPLVERLPVPWQAPTEPPPTMAARDFDRPLDLLWRRTSYSALTAAVHGQELPTPSVGSEAEPVHEDDEVEPALSWTPGPDGGHAPADPLAAPSPMGDLPSGVEFGTAVHAVLELVDPTADDLAAELRRATALALSRSGGGTLTVDQLAGALHPAFETPLGPLADDLRLCDIPASDRLAELAFEMPLAGGDTTRAEVTVGQIAPLLRTPPDPGRRLAPLPRPAGPPGSGRPAAARLPERQHRRGAPGPRRGGHAAPPGGRLQDELARQLRRPAAHRRRLHPGPAGRGDDGSPLPAAGPAVLGGRAPAAAVAPARLRPGHAPRRGAVPLRPGHGRRSHPAGRRRALRGLQLAAPGGPGHRALRPARRAPTRRRAAGMTAPVTGAAVGLAVQPGDPALVRGAAGLLGTFNTAGVLRPADVHTALAVARMAGETDETVQLALALTVRALRNGSVCLDLATVSGTVFDESEEQIDVSDLPWPEPAPWLDACRRSPLVTPGADERSGRPLRLAGGLLYLERYWQQEEVVRSQLQQRFGAGGHDVDEARVREALQRLFPRVGLAEGEPDRQQLAAAVSVLSRVTVLAGGPGTGKTTTVARLLALLHDQPGPPLRIALAAPTGKAAARLEEAVRQATAAMTPADRDRVGEVSASTLHRLLGWQPGSRSRFRHDATNHLPHDVLIVDEMSMVSLTMMARLLEAVRPDARVVLVGDPDQLSSVEAGAVLADIARAPGSRGRAAGPGAGTARPAGGGARASRRCTASCS